MIKLTTFYKTIEERDKWYKIKIPINKIFDDYKRTSYVEIETNKFIIEFNYPIYTSLLLSISNFIWNTWHKIKYKIIEPY